MIGRSEIEISAADLVRGMSSGDHIADRGFSPLTDAVNLTYDPGVAYAPAAMVDKSTNLSGNILASCGDANPAGNDRYFLTTNGKYFTWNGTTLTLRQTDATGSYVEGTSDMVQFQLSVFATSASDVALLTGSDLATLDEDWWTNTKGKSALQTAQRHPLLVYENSLWIGDKNKLHKWDGTTATEGALTLSSEQSITSLGVDVTTGLMLIGVTEGTNYSNTKAQIAKILVWDGTSNKVLRSIIVEDAVNAFYNISGTTFITYGVNLGYWNGSGISWLRRFKNVTLSGSLLGYKHHLTNINQTLYIADGKQVLAYGEVLPGQKVFYYVNSNQISSATYTCITHVGSGVLGFGFATAKFYTQDTTSVATTGTQTLYFNKINFKRPTFIRGIYIEWANSIADGDNNRSLYYQTQEQAGYVLLQDPTASFSALKNTTGAAIYNIFVDRNGISDNKVRSIQFRLNSDTSNYGFKRMVLMLDAGE